MKIGRKHSKDVLLDRWHECAEHYPQHAFAIFPACPRRIDEYQSIRSRWILFCDKHDGWSGTGKNADVIL